MIKMIIVSACLALAACSIPADDAALNNTSTSVPPAASLGSSTKIDEQLGLGLTLSYTAASRLAALAITTKQVTDPAKIKWIGSLDRQAFNAVQAARAAYLSGNADNYAAAAEQAQAAVTSLLSAIGEPR